jgi:asparagine synthase (glutamine-hydrolysing)
MAHGLELRVPYLDKDVVEYVERLASNLKVRNMTQKWVHRQVCESYLPSALLKRKKRGFAVNVVDEWFRSAQNNKMADMLLDGQSKMYEYLNPKAVESIFKEHVSGRSDNHKILFSLVVLEEWLRMSTAAQA